ncbi:coiled-coil domain-containing protein [Sesbania bispinosa]|nr:coiled-coil domain-containing protein [Sesbania bispinosa]
MSKGKITLNLILILTLLLQPLGVDSDRVELVNATESNVSLSRPSFADMIDRALEHEADPGSFNNSVAEQQAVLETVARVTPNKNDTKDEKSFPLHHVFNRARFTINFRLGCCYCFGNLRWVALHLLLLDNRIIWQVITGYLLAGSIVGPGGFNFISEMVQVSGNSNNKFL